MCNAYPTAGRPTRLPVLGQAVLLATIALLGLASADFAWGQGSDAQMRSILAEMAAQQHEFDPQQLHALGVAGLSAVLDELLPDTAQPSKSDVPDQTVAALIKQLGDDRFRAREIASQKLEQLGPGIRQALLEATADPDAEISWRAWQILRRWQRRQQEDKGRYLPAFGVYAAGINDDERLDELARRTMVALRKGVPEGSRDRTLRQCITTIAASGKDQYTNRLKPLLADEDVAMAVLVTQAVGAAVNDHCCPQLFLDALQADRFEVVRAAIGYVQNCGNNPRRDEVKRLLISVFEAGGDAEKFQVVLPLMHTFDYPQARDYLLQQLQTGDRNHQYRALSYLRSPRRPAAVADEKLLRGVVPLLQSQDNSLRRIAAQTLGVYEGEEVVKSLLPLLVDSHAPIPKEVKLALLRQRDKKMVRRVVAAAAEQHADPKLRQAAAEFLKQLD